MTTFAEIYAATQLVVRRPELQAQVNAAIALATMRAHHVEFFPRDGVSVALTYTPPQVLPYHSITNIYTTIPTLRSLNFIQNLSVDNFGVLETLQSWDQKKILDEYNLTRRGVYTQVGTEIRMYSCYHTGSARVFYYQNPSVTSIAYSSWIADIHMEEIAQWAAAVLYSRTGFLEQAGAIAKDHIVPFKELLKESYLLSEVN